VLIGRTDARASEALDAVIDRANRYVDAGADVIFVEEPHSMEELERLPREVQAPLLVNMCEGYKTPMVPAAQLNAMGYRLIIYPLSLLLYEVAGAKKVLETLHRDGCTTELINEMVTEAEVSEIVGMADAESLYARVYGAPVSAEAAQVGG
jgi:2,3-dimethylmalate lyase